jgi:hypothetical protein
MLISNETAMPNAGTDIEEMDLASVQAELAGYQPATASAVAHSEEHRERRARLWARLDALLGTRKPAIARPAVVAS